MSVRPVLGAVAVSGALSTTVLLGAAGPAQAQEATNLSATGSGADEVPAGSGEQGATVTGSFQLTAAGALTYTVKIDDNSEPITAGHLHEAPAGSNGPVVAPLDAAAINSGSSATTQIAPKLAAEIIANPQDYYLNTHSASFAPPSGNARAQLTAGAAAPGSIDTGSGGQAAGGDATTSYAVAGLAGLLIAGGAVAVRRRSHARP